MSAWEIIGGVLMLIAGIFIVIVVMLQESKQPGLSGSSSDYVLMGAQCSLLTIKICGSKIEERKET